MADPAPVLPALHRAQAREGRLTRQALERLAASTRIPLADLHSAATFYHYFNVDGQHAVESGVCSGPACSLAATSRDSADGATPIPCPGLCDQPVARYADGRFLSPGDGEGPFARPRPVDTEEALFRHIRATDPRQLANYQALGGYGQLLRLVQGRPAEEALETLGKSGLVGRGGAGFPLAAKWQAVRQTSGKTKYVVCNADEGEPGTFKDRPLLHLHPHLLLEAMAIAGLLTGTHVGIIYVRYEYPQALEVLTRAIAEAEEAGVLGRDIGGSGFAFQVYVRRGAGSYVCGEETALLNSLEGKRPWPRERPPFPTTNGLWGAPTVINNVETLCWVPLILEKGADWFRGLGRNGSPGTKLYSVSGKVQHPGVYELPLGVTARELIYRHAGGPLPGRSLKAFTLGGISGGLLGPDALDMPFDYSAPRERGLSLGSGGIVVLDDSCCVVDFVRTCTLFYEAESCGRCFPCRVGTVRLREILDGLTGRGALPDDIQGQVTKLDAAMSATSACGLGQGAPLVVRCMLATFSDEVEAHLKQRTCSVGVCPL